MAHRNTFFAVAALVVTGPALLATGPALARDFPNPLPLGSLDGTNGVTIQGVLVGDQSGGPARDAGDVNGDGISDLIIGAKRASPNGNLEAGESYVVFGTDQGFPHPLPLASLDGTNGFAVRGAAETDETGGKVSSAGDINNDGLDDVIIGAESIDTGLVLDHGGAYVIYGRHFEDDPPYPAAIELADFRIGPTYSPFGFFVRGVDSDDECGSSVGPAGDVNNDGIDDFLVGAQGANPNFLPDGGEAYVIFGRNGDFPAEPFLLSSLDGTNGFMLLGIDLEDETGRSVDTCGDVNGDMIDDIVVGASLGDPGDDVPPGVLDAGETYVVFGRGDVKNKKVGVFPAVVVLADLDGSDGFTIFGETPGDESGVNVAGVGDVNGDGLGDILIGSNNALGGAGKSYVVFGTDTESFPAEMNLVALNGTNGFAMTGGAAGDGAGRVGYGGDLNGDGLAEVIVGAPGANGGTGAAHVIFGSALAFPATIDLGALDGTNGFTVTGAALGDGAGRSVWSAGDFNGDGASDLAVGAKSAYGNAGETYVIFGEGGVIKEPCLGDTNGDGVVDVGDLVNVVLAWGTPDPDADFNGDGDVNVQDMVTVITNWGDCP